MCFTRATGSCTGDRRHPRDLAIADRAGARPLSDAREDGTGVAEPGLADVKARKALLHGLISVVRYMERIHEGLEAVLVLGEGSQLVPDSAREFLNSLDARMRMQPTAKVREYQDTLDNLVRRELEDILRLASGPAPLQAEADTAAIDADVSSRVQQFRRRAQTLISLRILLRKRGQEVPVSVLPVAVGDLRKALVELETRKKAEEAKVLEQAVELKRDVDQLVASGAGGETARAYLLTMQKELGQNIDHLKAGGPVSDLPFPMEAVEAVELDWLAPGEHAAEESESGSEPEPDPEIEPEPEDDGEPLEIPEDSADESVAEEAGGPPLVSPPEQAEDPALEERGFWGQLYTYLTTGPEVTWKRAKTWRLGK